ncbi:MAG: chorismate synthase [Deltaproteobacteria bacterium]|nr:chorismate synthase [Deltaproteobacteria bacterium]
MLNTFGHLFRITTFGESHGPALGAVIDGCPAGVKISLERIQEFVDRRRPGQSPLTTQRKENDQVECLSGLEDGVTLGSPIALLIRNHDARPKDYDSFSRVYRPSHADFTVEKKFGIRSQSGGGRLSARETVARVAAAGVAQQVLEAFVPDLKVSAFISSVHQEMGVFGGGGGNACTEGGQGGTHPQKMETCILDAKERGDTVGGTITCKVVGCPVGLGEPLFGKLHAELARALMSIPAARGFEIGLGFAASKMFGSEHNDPFVSEGGKIRTKTNHSGGIQGGISNGEDIHLCVAFKPPSTIFQEQASVDREGNSVAFKPHAGRHDPCVLPRAVPIVEAMVILVLVDHLLMMKSRRIE